MSRLTIPLLLLFSFMATGCATRYIGNTLIEDTSRNRAILQVVEQYRRAVEDRDVQRILDLTSDRFWEDPGTPGTPSDDYDKAGLRERLEDTFSKVEDQRLRIDVRKIVPADGGRNVAVEYRFDFRYKLALPSAGDWREAMDLNRIVLTEEDGEWKIISGL